MRALDLRALRATLIVLSVSACLGACKVNEPDERPPTVVTVTAPEAARPALAPAPASHQPTPELRAYTLPDAYRVTLTDELQRLLRPMAEGQAPLGRVAPGPGGQVLVLAPSPVHAGVAALIEALAERPPSPDDQPVQDRAFEATYWFVAAFPGERGRGDGLGDGLAPALDAIEQAQGGMRFELIERLGVRANSGPMVMAHGQRGQVKQRLELSPGGQVHGSFQLSIGASPELMTEISVPTSELLVLGQSGYVVHPDEATRWATSTRSDGEAVIELDPRAPRQGMVFFIARFDETAAN